MSEETTKEAANETTEETANEAAKPIKSNAGAGSKSKPKPKPKSKPKSKSAKASKKKWKKQRGNNHILFLIIIALVIAAVAAGILMWKHSASKSPETTDDMEVSEAEETTEEKKMPKEKKTPEIDIDVDDLFADIDAVVEEAKGKMDEDAEIVNVMDSLSSAVNDYIAKAEEAGDIRIAEDRAVDTYKVYIEAVEKHKEMMAASTLSGAIYAQVISELDAAFELGDALADNGYAIDLSELETSRSTFDSSYRQRIIDTFDEFTTRDTWSRTESWNLMKDTDSMFESSDLDDPIRLRYAYALAWWTQKQIETELMQGTITEKGAAVKIAGLLDVMDYNPMMLSYYIEYMKLAGESCFSVESAYNGIVERIRDTQGITLGNDIDLKHFWYFNDISDPSEGVKDGSVNGTTQENREWIRNRMEYVEFAS